MQELVNTTENNVHEMPKRGSKRKALTLDQNFIIQGAMLEPLDIQDLVLSCDKGKAHFQRLRYFGCPTLTSLGELDPSKDYINMRRDEFVRSMYHLFRPNFNITRKSNFELLTAYIRWLDEKQYSPIDGDYFHNLLIDAYMTHWGELVAGGAPKHSWSRAKHGISFVLKQLNRTADARKLPSIRGVKKEARKTQGLKGI